MNQLKKALATVLAVATLATVFTGCGKKNEEAFKAAMENSAKIESYKMTGNMSFSAMQDMPQEEGAENVENTSVMPLLDMQFDSTSMDKGLTTAMDMSMSMLGMGGIEQSVYLKDGVTYTSMDGDQTFIKQSLEDAAGVDAANLQEMGMKYNKMFMEKLDYSKVKYKTVEGGLSVTFAVDKDMYSGMIKQAFDEIYPEGLEEQMREETTSQLRAMGMTEEEIASPEIQAEIENSTKMVSDIMDIIMNDLEFSKFDVKLLVSEEQITAFEYDIEMNLKPLMDALAEKAPEMAGMFPADMRVAIKADGEISEINAVTAVEMPEFTAENSLTQEEMIQKAMEDPTYMEGILGEAESEAEVEETPAIVPAA